MSKIHPDSLPPLPPPIKKPTLFMIVAMDEKGGIGYKGNIPWNIPRDLHHFRKITENSTIIMGRKTWDSLPRKPLKNRRNIVITSSPPPPQSVPKNTYFMNEIQMWEYLLECSNTECVSAETETAWAAEESKSTAESSIFVIGGQSLYNLFIGIAEIVYVTLVHKECICDTFFPIEKLNKYKIVKNSPKNYCAEEDCIYEHITYML